MNKGKVYLVGAGPGDPGLITVRAAALVRQAEVILYDELVGQRITELFPKTAHIEYVGKSAGRHSVPQEEINRRLVEHGQAGKLVVRLKGGDPFVLGRGGEEAMACVEAGVPFEIVPGVTSAFSVPAYAGIPVTHRDASASVAVITGNRRENRDDLDIPAPDAETLIYLMGVKNLPNIVAALMAQGRSPDLPVAVIEAGTTPAQHTVTATLGTIVDAAEKAGTRPPSIIIIGNVVKYRERLSWFESRPLFGLRIMITRPGDQASELLEKLEEQGAAVFSLPAIAIQDLADPSELDNALDNLNQYHYIIFTSVNGVSRFLARMEQKGMDGRALSGLTIAAIGPRTARGLKERFINPDIIPEEYVAESLLDALPKDLTGKKVLIPRALKAREILPEVLKERGAEVDVIPAYETVAADEEGETPQDIDVIVFTSSSAVDHFLENRKIPQGAAIACIGPVTAKTIEEHGLVASIVAEEHTMDGLVSAIITWAAEERKK